MTPIEYDGGGSSLLLNNENADIITSVVVGVVDVTNALVDSGDSRMVCSAAG